MTPFELILNALLNQDYSVRIEKEEGLIFFKIENIDGQWTGEDFEQLSGVLIEGMIHTSLSRIDGADEVCQDRWHNHPLSKLSSCPRCREKR